MDLSLPARVTVLVLLLASAFMFSCSAVLACIGASPFRIPFWRPTMDIPRKTHLPREHVPADFQDQPGSVPLGTWIYRNTTSSYMVSLQSGFTPLASIGTDQTPPPKEM